MFDFSVLKTHLPSFRQAPHIWVAFSGGLDSSVLLHAIHELAACEKIGELRAIYINHGLHTNAEQWAQHCQKICAELNVDCQVIKVDASTQRGESPENCARIARYAAFAAVMTENDMLVTAHQQDDQAETLILQLFRGAGVKGLASMPAIIAFAKGYHLRPLLNVTRKQLEEYAAQKNLEWIDDESNKNLRFDRNFIRHELMPHIQQRWPQVTTTLTRVAENCAKANELLQQLAQEDLLNVQGSQPNTLSAKKLAKLSEIRWHNTFRYWLHSLDYSLPSQAQLQRVALDVLNSRNEADPKVIWGNVIIRRYRDDIYAQVRSKD